MRFHICLFNHPMSFETLFDQVAWIRLGLQSLGHTVTESVDQFDAGAINILWENFQPGVGRELRKLGINYGIVATEVPQDGTFNGRRDGNWGGRWAGFIEVAEGSRFIWSMVESGVPIYRRWAPSTFVELGYLDDMVERDPASGGKYDFCFLGSPRPYREDVITRLSRHASVYWPRACLPWEKMAGAMRSARLGLALKIDDRWPIPSATRLGRLLHARVGIAMDYTVEQTRQSRLVPSAPTSVDFVEYALERLASFRPTEADAILENYRASMPMTEIIERALDQTLAGS